MKSSRWINFVVLFVLTIVMISGRSVDIQRVEAATLEEGVLFVKPDSSGAENCSTWADACELQDALGVALYGDQIWAASGIYTPTHRTDSEDPLSATFEMKSGVGIYGGFVGSESELAERDWETNVTVLSGDLEGDDITDPTGVITDTANIVGSNAYHVVISEGVTETASLDGFSITGGDGGWGGGMYNVDSSSPTLTNVLFSGNRAERGGGMYNNNGSDPLLSNVKLVGNTAEVNGGGIYNYNSSPVLNDVDIVNNRAEEYGGGMDNYDSSPILGRVTFAGNIAMSGGGLSVYECYPTLIDVTFMRNIAYTGGGIFNDTSSSTLTNVRFFANQATSGGGIFNLFASGSVFTNLIFSGNAASSRGGGIYDAGTSMIILTNATFIGNTAEYGGGMSIEGSSPMITNTIMWGNIAGTSDPQFHISYAGSGTPSINYSDIEGGYEGDGNIDADPLFVRNPDPGLDGNWGTEDDDYGDLRLGLLSPAIDAGDNSAVPAEVTTDLDGNPRFANIPGVPDTGNGTAPIVDMGAYEVQNLVYLPLITH